jgi:hypothetical protein
MATLTRPKVVEEQPDIYLGSSVPAPFPRSVVEQDRYLSENNILPPPVASPPQVVLTTRNATATARRTSIHEDLKPVEPIVNSPLSSCDSN